MDKPLIVGESNPYGGDDYYALYPAPAGCSGHRLCCMDPDDYLEAFDRCNLCRGPWRIAAARDAAACLRQGGGPLILLGAKVASGFGLPFAPFTTPDNRTLILPHPSGRNPVWGQPGVIEKTRAAVIALAPALASAIGAGSTAF
jgi:hypothetical protein